MNLINTITPQFYTVKREKISENVTSSSNTVYQASKKNQIMPRFIVFLKSPFY